VPRTSFTGEHTLRVDGKGRMSIPADFRRVLEAGDPDWHEGMTPWLRLRYGDDLENRLEVRTVAGHAEVVERITAWHPDPDDEDEVADHEAAVYFNVTQSQGLEVDRDGRIVMPARFRAKLGMSEGEVTFAGKGDYFEIWAADTYRTDVSAKMQAYRATRRKGYNPLARALAKGA
jgi:MraZ protein